MSNKSDLVVINLDRPRFIRFGHKALKQITALTGKDVMDMDMNNFDLETLEKILYCGLLSDAKANNEILKLEDMEDLLDQAESYHELLDKMTTAINKTFGLKDSNEKN
jgi:phosphopantetheine adenylyltransferase